MPPTATTSLPPAPPSPVALTGAPRFGTYVGEMGLVAWDDLRHRPRGLRGRLREKSWHYVALATRRCLTAFAIIDLGWGSSAFVYVFDRKRRRLLFDEAFFGLPGVQVQVAARAGAGARSAFRSPTASLRLERPFGSTVWTVDGEAPGGFRLRASMDADGALPSLAAVAPIDGGVANCTHKTLRLPVSGTLEVGGRRIDLDGGLGALDHTHGLLGRETSWQWACAWNEEVGVNLVEGHNGPAENVIWVAGQMAQVGAARFSFDPSRPWSPWHIRTVDGLVDLTFVGEGVRQANVNLGLAVSRYIQPIGVFRGTLQPDPDQEPIPVELVGVTEDHFSRW